MKQKEQRLGVGPCRSRKIKAGPGPGERSFLPAPCLSRISFGSREYGTLGVWVLAA